MEGTHQYPLKKSPSSTKLGNFTPDSPAHGAEAGGESSMSMSNKLGSEKTHPPISQGMEGGHGIRDFETLYQFDPTALTRPASAFEAGPYPKGKLFDPIFEILQADQTLKRATEEQLPPINVSRPASYKDIEKVTETEEIDMDFTREEARMLAEEIILDMEQDLVEVLKFKGFPTGVPSDSTDGRYYI